MAPNFEAVVSVLLQMCGQICQGMPYPCIFVEELVPVLGEMTDKVVLTLVCGRNRAEAMTWSRFQQILRALNFLLVNFG